MKTKRLGIAALAAIMCTMLLLGGCASEPAHSSQDGSEKKVLTYALAGELTNLSPMLMNSDNPGAVKMVYETLIGYAAGEFQPALAERWEFNDDQTELTLYLRKGVTFHDGSAFDAEAVKANLEHQGANPNAAFMRAVSTISNIEIVDEHTIRLIYSAPYVATLNDFTYPDVMTMAAPSTLEEGNFETLTGTVGTGPYIYEEFVKGSHTRLVRNTDYWGEAPQYDEIIIKYIPEPASRLKALQTGEIDLIFGSSLMTYDEYQQALKIPGIEGTFAQGENETRNLAVNASGTMFSDVNVRRAVAMAIDKKAISDGLTYGYEAPADTLFPEGTPYTDITMNNLWRYDTQKAAALLDEAGWKLNASTGIREKDGAALKINLTYDNGVSINKDIATAIDSQLMQVGIDVETLGMEQMQWWMEAYSGNYDLTIWNVPGPPEIPHTHFTIMLDSSAEYAALLGLPDVQDVYNAINVYLSSADETEVQKAFDFLINHNNDNVIDIPLTYSKEMIVYNSEKISGYTFYGVSQFFDIYGLQGK